MSARLARLMSGPQYEPAKIEEIASYADEFQEHDFGYALDEFDLASPQELREADQWTVLKFVVRFRIFEDQAAVFDEPALTALERLEPSDHVDPDQLWDEFKTVCRDEYDYDLFQEKTEPVLRGTANLYNEHGHFIDWIDEEIAAENLDAVYDAFTGIKYVGPKITKFIIRDFVWVLNDEEAIPEHHQHYLHPIDGWVRRVSEAIWPSLQGESQDTISDHLADACRENRISHIEFNQGAFYFGGRIVDDEAQIDEKLEELIED